MGVEEAPAGAHPLQANKGLWGRGAPLQNTVCIPFILVTGDVQSSVGTISRPDVRSCVAAYMPTWGFGFCAPTGTHSTPAGKSNVVGE